MSADQTQPLSGGVALITGATRGQGRAYAVRLSPNGSRIIAKVADIRDLDALSDTVTAGVGELGRLDVVVANPQQLATPHRGTG